MTDPLMPAEKAAAQQPPPQEADTRTAVIDAVNSGAMMHRGPVCYFVSCKSYERSYADDMQGTSHCIFSYYFLKSLKSLDELWLPVKTGVITSVAHDTDNNQTPTISVAYVNTKVFGGPHHRTHHWRRTLKSL